MMKDGEDGTRGRRHECEVVILGAGFGGLCMAIKLLEAGIDDFVVLEKGAEVGGTWRDNTYPGAECDVQSHLYSYSFDGKPDWSQRYAGWREIQQYILDTTARHGLRAHIRFKRTVNAAHFDAEGATWTIGTVEGETYRARHFVLATGPLHVPQIPGLPGLGRFQGRVFHSARWDHDYALEGQRVASIGTGGSAIQYCPEIAPRVARLYVFQRTPGWIIPRDVRSYSAGAKRRFARHPWWRKLHRARLYWSNESRVWPLLHPWFTRPVESLCRRFIRWQVKDASTAAALTPNFRFGCKRVLISNAWYPMFNRHNVELVTAGIREVREHSIVTADGTERAVDCIILGTGFVVDPRIYMQNFPVTGLPGHTLAQDWKGGAEDYYGITVTGYPNLFQLVGPNTALGHNSIIFMIECQARYIVACMGELKARGADYIDTRPEAQREFNARVQGALRGTAWNSGCVSWYQQADGKNFTIWPWSTWRYWLQTRRVHLEAHRFVRAGGAEVSGHAPNEGRAAA
ncbi:MAG TPA: NAD(P)/FAD-dependent oxidoreductase [Steroidobacteraceae bacterium]|nr:NAD(P)/FAD-dependent oxidoreductase [Steroidobacteraceae bacterium]